jgi:hypothetical protein
MRELDSFYVSFEMGCDLKRLPSEYVRENVYLGASFISPSGAEESVADGYVDNVLWGRDYPHIEGVFQDTVAPDQEPMTKLSLRHVFHRIPPVDTVKILGGNALGVFGLSGEALQAVADRIGAPTPADLSVAPTALPENDGNGFLGQAGPRPLEPERVARAERRRALLSAD